MIEGELGCLDATVFPVMDARMVAMRRTVGFIMIRYSTIETR